MHSIAQQKKLSSDLSQDKIAISTESHNIVVYYRQACAKRMHAGIVFTQ